MQCTHARGRCAVCRASATAARLAAVGRRAPMEVHSSTSQLVAAHGSRPTRGQQSGCKPFLRRGVWERVYRMRGTARDETCYENCRHKVGVCEDMMAHTEQGVLQGLLMQCSVAGTVWWKAAELACV